MNLTVRQLSLKLNVQGPAQLKFSLKANSQPVLSFLVGKRILLETPAVGAGGEGSNHIQLISPISVSSGRLIAYINNTIAYYNPASTSNLYALAGMSIVAANPGEPLTIQPSGEVTIPGWGLTPDHFYFAGPAGTIVLAAPTAPGIFSQVVGRAKNANTFIFSPQTIYINGNN